MDFCNFLDSRSYDQVCKYVSMQVYKYMQINAERYICHFWILRLMTNPNKLYDPTSSFTNYVNFDVYSKKPLNMQAFHFVINWTVQSKVQIDCMFALRHFFFLTQNSIY